MRTPRITPCVFQTSWALAGWCSVPFPGEIVPISKHPLDEKPSPDIQPKPSLTDLLFPEKTVSEMVSHPLWIPAPSEWREECPLITCLPHVIVSEVWAASPACPKSRGNEILLTWAKAKAQQYVQAALLHSAGWTHQGTGGGPSEGREKKPRNILKIYKARFHDV